MFKFGDSASCKALCADLRQGKKCEIDEAMFDFWQDINPPAVMGRMMELCDGTSKFIHFGYAEGFDIIIGFWMDGDRWFCQNTKETGRS